MVGELTNVIPIKDAHLCQGEVGWEGSMEGMVNGGVGGMTAVMSVVV